MKKHLIAAGVVAAFAAPAMAQNVSVYGIIDMAYTYTDTDTSGGNSGLTDGNIATSRLGFRGSEDLGGGLKAEFQLEGKLQTSYGEIGNKASELGTATGNNVFDREAWVGLAGGFGAIRIGRTDITDIDNIDSKVSQAGNLGLIANSRAADQAKSIRYTTPTFNGISAQIGYASPNTATTSGVVENTFGSTESLYVQYENGPLGIYAGYNKQKTNATLDEKETTVGAKYNFGVASVGLVYSSRDNQQGTATSYSAVAAGKDLDMYVLSVAVPLQQGFTLHGLYESQDLDGSDAQADAKFMTLAVTKALSKRTSLYAAFVNTDKDLSTEKDSKSYSVGITHSF